MQVFGLVPPVSGANLLSLLQLYLFLILLRKRAFSIPSSSHQRHYQPMQQTHRQRALRASRDGERNLAADSDEIRSISGCVSLPLNTSFSTERNGYYS